MSMNSKLLNRLLAAAVLGGLTLSASAQNLALVNGKPIPLSRFTVVKQQMEQAGQPMNPGMEAKIREELIKGEILSQAALKRGLATTEAYQQQMSLMRDAVLSNLLMQDFKAKNPIADSEAKAEYDKFVAANGGKEYLARHILVKSEDRAKAIIREIKGGKKLEDIAKKESLDTGSGARGGELDWAAPGRYVAEFATALKSLKKGEMTNEPVRSEFGWHIIRVEDERDAQMPKFEEIKPQIVQMLEEQKLGNFQNELLTNAKIEPKTEQPSTPKPAQ